MKKIQYINLYIIKQYFYKFIHVKIKIKLYK